MTGRRDVPVSGAVPGSAPGPGSVPVPVSAPVSGPVSAPLYEVKANLFKGLSHPFRIRILEIIVREGEVAVAQLLAEMNLEASHLSQHLAVLRRHHLVRSQRRASSVFYQVAYPEVAQLLATARTLLSLVVADHPAAETGGGETPSSDSP